MPLPFTPLIDSLPSTVPFVGPEALERRTIARLEEEHRRGYEKYPVQPTHSAPNEHQRE